MSFEEEATLLEQFKAKAEKGQLVEISEIKEAYDKAIGHKSGSAQIYRVLHRHGWRKVMPRSKHPQKASNEAIEASKKLKIDCQVKCNKINEKIYKALRGEYENQGVYGDDC